VGVRVNKKVQSFQDLDVYNRLYGAMLLVAKEILPLIPNEEKYSLTDQMRRASKAPLVIIAEGYAKKNYKKDWQRYITDAIGECNEMIAHLSCCRDIYGKCINRELIDSLIKEYDVGGKQLYRLGQSWKGGSDYTHPHPYNPTHNPQPTPTQGVS